MDLMDIYKLFPIHLPIADKEFWNGKPDEFSNIGWGLNYSQRFGLTPYAKMWNKDTNNYTYGSTNGKPNVHNGHDFAGFKDTPLVFPCKAWVSFVGYDSDGYGNYCFFETETRTWNGETVKMEYVLAHMDAPPVVKVGHWYNAGDAVGLMGKTGMSTGYHTHFGGRPLIRNADGSWRWLFAENRGYIDLEPSMIEKPVFDKQILINIQNTMADFEKKLIVEGEGAGRKYVVVNGELREITKDREADAALYVLTNNGMGKTVPTSFIANAKKGKTF